MTEDLELLAELGALLRRGDAPPQEVRAAAEALFALAFPPPDWVRLEELAGDPVPVRSGARTLRFGDGEFSLRLEPRGPRLVGLVCPVAPVRVRWPGGECAVEPDSSGVFWVEPPRGPVQVIIGETRATRWFRW
jgi:hypothetical protein